MALLQILGVYGALSATTFVLYALDKSSARRSQWRVPENMLHLLALLGGWPGAWLAQQVFRHKTRKSGFQFVFLLTIAVNLGFLVWMLYR